MWDRLSKTNRLWWTKKKKNACERDPVVFFKYFLPIVVEE